MDTEQQQLWLLLHRMCSGSGSQLRKLQRCADNPHQLLDLDPPAWAAAGLSVPACEHLRAWRRQGRGYALYAEVELQYCSLRDSGVVIVAAGSRHYPPLLAQIHDPPALLYVRGNPALLGSRQLAVVGSRKISATARRATLELVSAAVARDYTITSGLALGVDQAAHTACLDAEGNTVAVMATGIDRIYPLRHRVLAEKIELHGALVTELLPGTPPQRHHFPRRNRVISGLSRAVLVVEAALRSGSLITARTALEQDRDVLAVPHSMFHSGGAGCNQLLRQGAALVDSPQQLLFELEGGLLTPVVSAEDSSLPEHLQVSCAPVYAFLSASALAVDELANLSGLPVESVQSALLQLELEGYVESSFGRFARAR